MVANRNAEAVLDPKLPEKPTSRALKRALLVALRCVDPNAQKRSKMGHVIHMLEAEDSPFKEVCMQFCRKFKFNVLSLVHKQYITSYYIYHQLVHLTNNLYLNKLIRK